MTHLSPAPAPGAGRRTPPRALAFAVASLVAPLLAMRLSPEWAEGDGAILVWLPTLLPAFVLAYYRGWQGASLALAGGMATLAASQAGALLLALPAPPPGYMLATLAVLTLVSLGAGWVAELLLRAREEAEAAALTDLLTGLPNRRHASVFLEAAWGAAVRGRDMAVVLFDLDRFKDVNDAHGHDEGDRVLKALAGTLAARTRRMDLSARYGGEEFISVLMDCTPEEARAFAEDVRTMMATHAFGWGGVTLSAGVAAAGPDLDAPGELVAAADRALYAAKAQGRNRVVVAQANAPTAPGPQGSSPPAPPEARHVLLVDDDPGALQAHARLLTHLGYRVHACPSEREALAHLAAERPVDLLVTDIVMPTMSGFTLGDQASKARPDLPVIYVSGYPRDEVYWGGTPGVRSVFLEKPLRLADLRAAVEGLLAAEPVHGQGGAQPLTAPAAPDPAGAPRRRGRILLVDDDETVLRTLQRLFERAGYPEPLALSDPARVVPTLASEEVDLVILDLDLGPVSGFEVLEAIRGGVAEDEFLPVIMLTGSGDPTDRRRALASGAMDFLGKPFDAVEAETRVRNLLTARFLTQSLAEERDRLEEAVAERTSELADTRTEILFRLARAAEYRDDITGRHAERVGLLASALMTELGRGPREADLVRRTAPLHDVGKIGIPDAILLKPDRLSPTEFEVMKAHTTIGAQILGGSRHRILEVARVIALHHHERWDGLGYPRGLAGQEIPLEARVVAVADTFDTITHDRPYKRPLSPEGALEEIRRCRGTHYDPAVVDALEALAARVGVEHLHDIAAPLHPREDTVRD